MAAPNIVESPMPSQVSAGSIPINPNAEIKVRPPSGTPVVPSVKPQKAMDRLKEGLGKISKPAMDSTTTATPRPATQPEPPKPGAEPAATPAEPAAEPAAAPEPVSEPGKGKQNPWKLVDDYKGRLAKAETRLAELTKGQPSEESRAAETQRVQQMEARVKELEGEIRYHDYTKSAEFKQKYQAPYDSAWKRAMGEIRELEVSQEDGTARPVTANDLLDLVNLPLPKAREMATKMFGDFAGDVMAHRKEIRSLFDAQQEALGKAREDAETREKLVKERNETTFKAIQGEISSTWNSANEEVLADPKIGHFFKEVEGDDEHNTMLKKGFQLADRAFSENPNDPRLKPEQRAEIVRRHAALRNRAAAFGVMRVMLDKRDAQIKDLTEQLAQFKGTVPSTGGGAPNGATPVAPAKAMDRLKQGLQKIAVTR